MIKDCLRVAQRELSNHKESHRHWSFIIQDKKIIEWGINLLGEPTGVYFVGYQPGRHGLHSEVTALSKARGLIDLRRRWTLINIRLTAAGVPAMAAPCPICASFMKACGCSQFIYSDPHGRFVKILPENFTK